MNPVSAPPSAEPRARTGGRSAATALVAGLLLLLTPPLVELVADDIFGLLPVALLLAFGSLPGLHRVLQGADGQVGEVGPRLVLGGTAAVVVALVGVAVLDVEVVALVVAVAGLVALLVGLCLVTLGMLRSGAHPTWGVVLFGPGMVLALMTESFEQTLSGAVPVLADVLPPTFFFLSGVGLVAVARSARRLAAEPSAARP